MVTIFSFSVQDYGFFSLKKQTNDKKECQLILKEFKNGTFQERTFSWGFGKNIFLKKQCHFLSYDRITYILKGE